MLARLRSKLLEYAPKASAQPFKNICGTNAVASKIVAAQVPTSGHHAELTMLSAGCYFELLLTQRGKYIRALNRIKNIVFLWTCEKRSD